MSDRRPVAILPNLFAKKEVGGEVVAFVSCRDPRVRAFCTVQPKFKEFLSRFTDALGGSPEPVFIISASAAIQAARPKLIETSASILPACAGIAADAISLMMAVLSSRDRNHDPTGSRQATPLLLLQQ